jgi:UDP-N-acetylmuramoyl-L-alanyl-D-glutamate--2,6-diaminopimelate ligase
MNRLLDEVEVLETVGDPRAAEVTGIAHDSRRANDGDLFVCLPGTTDDGHDHAAEAVHAGAVGLLCEHVIPKVEGVPQVRVGVGRSRPALASVSAAFFGHPSQAVTVVGVTGTNGKTTVTHLVAAALSQSGIPTEVIGTLTGERTTPEANELQHTLADVRDRSSASGPRPAVVMEVSSHALVQSRVDAVAFDVAVFTNLSHDHLDFHGNMEAYWEAKASLFTPARTRMGVVNADDPWGRRILERAAVPVVAVRADLVSDVVLEPGRTTFLWRGSEVLTRLTGRANVDNALLAAETALALGLDPATIAAGLAGAPVVPGRLELIRRPGGTDALTGPTVFVDFAHTPAALEAVLVDAGRLVGPGGRVVVVFGCGGDRDAQKRPLMGAAAERLAAVSIITSDNPRHEHPETIISEVCSGFSAGAERAGRLIVEPDRRKAIELALRRAEPPDVVVIAGKGHETYQQIGEDRLAFDDRVVATQALHGLASGTRD